MKLEGRKQIGYFAYRYGLNATRFTKIHAVIDEKPICGCVLSPAMRFQWCCQGHYGTTVECLNCKRILEKEEVKDG